MARVLLQAQYHCSGSDTLLGSANVGASIFILLLIGFVVGGGCSTLFFWWKQRRRVLLDVEWQPQHTGPMPNIEAMVRAAQTPTIRDGPKPSFRTAAPPPLSDLHGPGARGQRVPAPSPGAGPLKRGWVGLSSWAASSKSPDPSPPPTASPFVGVPSYDVMTNPVASASLDGSILGRKRPVPCADSNGGDRSDEEGGGGGDLIASATFNPLAVSGEALAGPHSRQDTVVLRPAPLAHGVDAPGVGQPAGAHASPDYAAAVGTHLGGPEEVCVEVTPGVDPAVESQHRKQEMLSAVQLDSYGMEDLDPEWRTLLSALDAKLQAGGAPLLTDRERAIAIRSLVVATASRSAEEAMDKALADVRLNRLTHQMMRRE